MSRRRSVGPDPAGRPFDVGLQPERTALAWRRACLALAGTALLCCRVGWTLIGAWALVVPGGVVLVAAALYAGSDRRYRRMHAHLTVQARAHLPDGLLPAVMVIATMALGVCALLWATGRPHT